MGKISEVLTNDKTETILKVAGWIFITTAAGIGASKSDEKTQKMFKKMASIIVKDKAES